MKKDVVQVNDRAQIIIGRTVKNCGLPEPCPKDQFAVHVFTGANDKDEPLICIDGK
jgi:hypothetical protein